MFQLPTLHWVNFKKFKSHHNRMRSATPLHLENSVLSLFPVMHVLQTLVEGWKSRYVPDSYEQLIWNAWKNACHWCAVTTFTNGTWCLLSVRKLYDYHQGTSHQSDPSIMLRFGFSYMFLKKRASLLDLTAWHTCLTSNLKKLCKWLPPGYATLVLYARVIGIKMIWRMTFVKIISN